MVLCDILGIKYKVNCYLGLTGYYRAISIGMGEISNVRNKWYFSSSLFKAKDET